MNGWPKQLNTRFDFDQALSAAPTEYVTEKLRDLIATYRAWFPVYELATAEEGITNETHRVVDMGMPEDPGLFVQEQYCVDPDAKLFRLGFTVEEVEGILAGLV